MSNIESKSQVTSVTVYTDRAIVVRTSEVEASPGKQTITLTDVPERLQEDSVRIKGQGPGSMRIQDFKLRTEMYQEIPESRIQILADRQQELQDKQRRLDDALSVLDHQKNFLQGIYSGSAEQSSRELQLQRPQLEDWKGMLEFVGTEMSACNAKILEHELEKRKIQAELNQITYQLSRYSQGATQKRRVVDIEVEIPVAGTYTFELSYTIHDAHWTPMYDARVDSDNKKVHIRYFGMVHQRSGEDWEGVKVSLSTARPQLGATPPSMHVWNVSPYVAAPVRRARAMAKKSKEEREESYLDYDEDMAMEESVAFGGAVAAAPPVPGAYISATVQAGAGSSVVFETQGRGDIPGDGSPGKLLIMENEFGNEFHYLTLPRLAEQVYLQAEVENTTEFPLLPGKVNIFLDENFIGNSSLQEVITPEEKFTLDLGVDEYIKVKYKELRKKGDEKGLFTKHKVMQYAYLITLESQRKTAESVIVRDHLPVSSDERIKVDHIELKPAENPDKDKDALPNGTLEWKIPLEAKGTARLELSFQVSYPRDLQVTGL